MTVSKKFPFEYAQFNAGEIEQLSDEQIEWQLQFFRRAQKEASRLEMDTTVFEEEICYLSHEKILREQCANGDFANTTRGWL